MYQRKTTNLIQSLLLATVLSSGLIASACSAESSNIPVLSDQSTPNEMYELGLAYYEGDSVLRIIKKLLAYLKKLQIEEIVQRNSTLVSCIMRV